MAKQGYLSLSAPFLLANQTSPFTSLGLDLFGHHMGLMQPACQGCCIRARVQKNQALRELSVGHHQQMGAAFFLALSHAHCHCVYFCYFC